MRIGMIAPAFPPALGGMEELAANLAHALASSVELTVYTLADRGVPGAQYAVSPGLSGDPQQDARELGRQEEGVDVWLGMQASTARLAGKLKRPFFVYCNGNDFLNPWEPHPLATWAGRTLSRTPLLWRYAMPVQSALKQQPVRNGLRDVRHAIAISHETASLLSRVMQVPASKVTVIPPGVHEDFFQERDLSARGELRVLTVCRLPSNSRKNVDGVLRAMALVRDLPASYTIVGDGDGRQELEWLARELDLLDRVRFTGSLDRASLLAAYRQADLFVLAARASATDVEGFGIVYLEASASGVPVLASRKGGAIDAVEEGLNGILIPTSEPPDIAEGIRRFVQTRERFNPSGVRAFAENFRWPRIADQLRQCLAQHL